MAGRSVRFEHFRFDPDTGELERDDAPVVIRLQEQPCRVLKALTSNAGALVTREDLHKLLWPENSLVDADNGLNIAINKIRLALGDSAATPRFVQTIPRRGYKFIAAVDHQPEVVSPVRVEEPTRSRHFRFLASGIAVALVLLVFTAWRSRPVTPTIQSAAMIPFANLSGDPSLDYAAQGLTETLATELAARGLGRVISTDATAHFKGSRVSPTQVSRELRADALVFGTVVREGASYAVDVRLLEGSSERHLWAARFRRATAMELTFSEDLVAGLAAALGLTVAQPRVRLAQVTTAARNEYLQGRYFWNLRTDAGIEKAVEHLTAAIAAQPDYALAWAALAQAYALGAETPSAAIRPWPGDPDKAGVEAAERALQLDPTLGEAHAALGRFRMIEWRWAEAEQEFAEAVRLTPNDATTRQWYGTLLSRLQKCPSAIEQALVGGEIDPITPIVNEAIGVTYAACGQPERARQAFQRVLAMHPEFASTHMRLAGTYLRLGDAASALSEYREAARLWPKNCEIQARMTRALVGVGKRVEAHALAARIVADAGSTPGSMCAVLAYANTGDLDGAFAALDAAVARRGGVSGILADFHLSELREDPRWSGILDKVGLTPYAHASAHGR